LRANFVSEKLRQVDQGAIVDNMRLSRRLQESRFHAGANVLSRQAARILSLRRRGIKGLPEEDRLNFSMEADFELSAAIVDQVNREIRDMRRPSRGNGGEDAAQGPAQVRERNLRYRIEVEMLPRSGLLRVADEYLPALTARGGPTGKRTPFIERMGEKLHLRLEG
jgi:hypothetical protein